MVPAILKWARRRDRGPDPSHSLVSRSSRAADDAEDLMLSLAYRLLRHEGLRELGLR